MWEKSFPHLKSLKHPKSALPHTSRVYTVAVVLVMLSFSHSTHPLLRLKACKILISAWPGIYTAGRGKLSFPKVPSSLGISFVKPKNQTSGRLFKITVSRGTQCHSSSNRCTEQSQWIKSSFFWSSELITVEFCPWINLMAYWGHPAGANFQEYKVSPFKVRHILSLDSPPGSRKRRRQMNYFFQGVGVACRSHMPLHEDMNLLQKPEMPGCSLPLPWSWSSPCFLEVLITHSSHTKMSLSWTLISSVEVLE